MGLRLERRKTRQTAKGGGKELRRKKERELVIHLNSLMKKGGKEYFPASFQIPRIAWFYKKKSG